MVTRSARSGGRQHRLRWAAAAAALWLSLCRPLDAVAAADETAAGSIGVLEDLPAEETQTAAAAETLRFHVPFAVVLADGLDLEPRATAPADLRVRRKLADAAPPACAAADNEQDEDAALAAAPFLAVAPSDQLVAVDGVAISLQPFDEVIDAPVGSVVMLPLFATKGSAAEGSNILTGFARVEIVRAQSVEFAPTSDARAAQLQNWQAARARAQQREQQREQDAREAQAAAENDALEREARDRQAREETYRLEMTPHALVGQKRADGREFRYEVEFATRGPIGLNWDLLVADRALVSHVEPKLAAERAGVIAPRDQLVQLNDVDTEAMGPAEVVAAYLAATPPRRMVFRCAARAGAKGVTGATAGDVATTGDEAAKTENWTAVFEAPAILRGWRVRLHLATWSLEPRALADANTSVTLEAADPLAGCQAPTSGGDATAIRALVAYRGGCSFVDKAEKALAGGARALVVVNNVKGLGRFPQKMPDVADVALPVTMIGKLDGEFVLSVLEYERDVRFRVEEEDLNVAEALRTPPAPPPKLTNQEMAFRRDPKKAARVLTLWYVDARTARQALAELRILPALFGNAVPAAEPLRVVMAYPQDTACHPQGLGVLAAQSVILVKRGGCSFSAKAKSVQTVGGAGMIMINSDESLLPLMGEPKEIADITIWAASISLSKGTFLETRLLESKSLPTLVTVAPAAVADAA